MVADGAAWGRPRELSRGAIMTFKQKLMACTALLGAWLLVPATAGAQSASEKIERLERQTELLQRQLKELQAELAQTKKKTERVEERWTRRQPVARQRRPPALSSPRDRRHRLRRKK